ncbi:hypothetical protein BDZ97DRAFT_1772969, partial [Flammula alnicola]
MPPNLKLNAVAFYHYIAHTSLDVIEERGTHYAPLRIISLPFRNSCSCREGWRLLSRTIVLYGDIFKALHMAYYSSISNPFLKLNQSGDSSTEQSPLLAVGSPKWKNFKRRVDEISWI